MQKPPPPPPRKPSSKKDKSSSSKKDKNADPKLMAKQLKSLQAFYKKHAPDKDPDDVADIVMKAKRRSGGNYYAEMCEKLEEKYGENPAVYLDSVSDADEEPPAAKDSSDGEKKKSDKKKSDKTKTEGGGDSEQSATEKLKALAAKSGKVRKDILTKFYAKHSPEKSEKDIEKIVVSESL
jgi:hypothetical protein